MLRPRIIPTLLVHNGGLVKTVQFRNHKYVGDPINAVRIFNEKEADELIVLDIDASRLGRSPDMTMISRLAEECRMPLCYGGGIRTKQEVQKLIDLGVEKVALSSAVVENPGFVSEVSEAVGRQSIVCVLDVRKKSSMFSGDYEVTTLNGTKQIKGDPFEIAQRMEQAGAGEILINFIDRDGKMLGYDLEAAKKFKSLLSVPTTFLGGAGTLEDMRKLIEECGLVGAAAGSLFVFKGQFRAVLINYPSPKDKQALFRHAAENSKHPSLANRPPR